MDEILKQIGLTQAEIKLYTALLQMGPSSVGQITGRIGMYRKNAYDGLRKLGERGLVSQVIEKRIRQYQAKSPDNLLKYLDEKEARLNEQRAAVEKSLPQLTKTYRRAAPEIEAEVYQGLEGIKTILNNCLECKEVLFIGATGDVENRLPYFWPRYNATREERKIGWKLLLKHSARDKKITASKYYDYKVLPPALDNPVVIYIYGDCVANVLWLDKPVAFVVRQKELAGSYRKYFDYLWQLSKS